MKEDVTEYTGYKTGDRKKSSQREILLLVCLGVFCFFNCGLETYYYLERPYFISSPSTSDPLERIFRFETADAANSPNGDVYQGCEIYYRIYNNRSRMGSDAGTIANRNTEYSSDGMNKLRDLNYQRMTSNSGELPLVRKSDSNRRVNIRLFEEGEVEPYLAGIYIGNVSIENGQPTGGILRYNNKSFDFEKDEEYPQEIDADVDYSSSLGTDIWYVQAYAVSYGLDTLFSAVYSQLLPLDSIEIDLTD